MSRHLSLWVLLGTVVGVGILFFHVVQPFLLPLFLALVLALLFWPLYERVIRLCRGRRRVAALLATCGILCLVVIPLTAMLAITGQRLVEIADRMLPRAEAGTLDGRLYQRLSELRSKLTREEFTTFRKGVLDGRSPTAALPSPEDPAATDDLAGLERSFSPERLRAELAEVTVHDLLAPQDSPWFDRMKTKLAPYVPPEMLDRFSQSLSAGIGGLLHGIYRRTQSFMATVVTAVIGFLVMAFALYYFFADGPGFAQTFKKLVPLDVRDEMALFHRFDDICRGVVLGVFAAAVAQAVLLGIGLTVAGVPYVWLLSILTLVTAMIPVVGPAAVYVPVVAYLIFQERYVAGVLLLCYGVGIISTIDNLIRAFVLQGRAQLHPLVGLVSMLGGLQFIGLWGIFIGPIVAGFFYSLLKILHHRLEETAEPGDHPDRSGQPAYETSDGGVIVPS